MSIGVDSWFTVFGFGAGAGELRQDEHDFSGFTGLGCPAALNERSYRLGTAGHGAELRATSDSGNGVGL